MSLLKPSEDAFGQMLLDAWRRGEPIPYVIERDDGLIEVDWSTGYFSSFADWPPAEQSALKYAQSPVLDLGCGAGRHALYLQEKGLSVVAMDVSPGALTVTQERGIKKTVQGNFCELPPFQQSFSAFLALGQNFGLCGGPEETCEMLQALGRIANPAAVLIASFLDPRPDSDETDPVHRDYHAQNQLKGKPAGLIAIRIRYRKIKTPFFPLYHPTIKEFRDILQKTEAWALENIQQAGPQYFAVLKRTTTNV
ncbi:MAG: class I SAM-dependent DNA methyltransferase [Candidatus Hodarchaeales archaeon]|jgi:SAM-dependent methyltransferase